MPFKTGSWCYRCGAYDHEPAGEKCTNPGWHSPNAAQLAAQARADRDTADQRLAAQPAEQP